jgi:thiol:disulfide interchange protein DsbD
MGFLMFFVLSIGLGIPFILLGTFSGSAAKLPRAGDWMVWVRKVFGFILIGLAIYFVKPLLSEFIYWGGLIATTFVGGIYLGWIDKATSQGRIFPYVKKAFGSLAILLGIFLILPEKEVPAVEWQTYDEILLAESAQKGQPVMIDFYADWCIPCKELDEFTFTDERVIELSQQFLNLKADLTKEGSDQVQNLREKFRILGVPTIVFIDATGEEREDLRVTGFLEAKEFGKLMEHVLNKSNVTFEKNRKGEKMSSFRKMTEDR